MSQAGLLISFWGYALESPALTLNWVPTKSVEKTPYEIWIGKCFRMRGLCQTFDVRQLTPKSNKCFFLEYPRETKGYYFYNQTERKLFVAHNGIFLEKEFLSKGVNGSKVQLEEIWNVPETVSAPH